MNFLTVVQRLFIPFVLVAVVGCGGSDGPDRVQITGAVTFRGQPVTSGIVCFTPDAKRGNRGPQGIARIVDGKYATTDRGKGAVKGPQLVEIRGFGPAAPTGDSTPFSPGQRLFPPYSVEIDVTDDKTSFDFDVPESAATRQAR